MHYNLYFKALEVLKGKDIDEFIGGNDISIQNPWRTAKI